MAIVLVSEQRNERNLRMVLFPMARYTLFDRIIREVLFVCWSLCLS